MNARAHKRDGTHLPEMLGYNVRMAGKKSDKMEYTKEYVYQVFDGRVRDRIEDVKRMFFEGYSFTDVAKELDVSNSLLWSMMRNKNPRYDALREAMTFGEFAVGNVEQSLYRKATGYYYFEEQTVVTTKEYFNKKGKKCKEQEIKVVPVRKYMPSDTNAIKFFLLNHAAKRYSPEGSADQAQQEAMIEGLKNVFVTVKKTADEGGSGDE